MTSKHQFDGHRVRISDVFDLQMGKTPSRKNPLYWRDGNHDWVSIADLGSFGKYVGKTKERINDFAVKESGIKLTPANTVLMSFKLSLGKTSITTEPVYTNEAIMAFINKGLYPVDTSFMYHQCRSKDWAAGTNAAVMGKTLNKRTLGQSVIFLPSLEEQEDIAAKLDFIDEQLQKAKDVLHELDSLVKSRFVEMFGDPIDGTFWAKRKLSNLYEVKSSKRIYAREQTKDGVPFLRLADIGSLIDSGISDSGLFISEERFEELRSKGLVPNPGDVLVTARGTLGRCYIIKPSDCFYFQDGMITWLAAIESSPLPSYLLAVFNNPHFIEELNRNCSGTTVKYLSISDLANVAIPVPPLELQHEFETFVTQVDKSRLSPNNRLKSCNCFTTAWPRNILGNSISSALAE